MDEYLEMLKAVLGPDYKVEGWVVQAKVTYKGSSRYISQAVEPSVNLPVAVMDAAQQIKIAFGAK